MEVLTDCEGRLRDAASKKILIEVTLLKAIQARNSVRLDTVLEQLQQLRNDASANVANGSSTSVQTQKAAPVSTSPLTKSAVASPSLPADGTPEAPVAMMALAEIPGVGPVAAPAAAAPAPADQSSVDLEALWTQVVEAVGRVSQFTKTYLLEAHPVSLAQKLFTIGFDPEFADHLGLVDNSKNRTLIQTKLQELGYGEAQVKFIQAEAPAKRGRPTVPETTPLPTQTASPNKSPAAEKKLPTDKPAAAPLSKEDFKNDPLIQQALEIFKGQIVDVRG
jgi:DNA polymerase-3 subunit gamma/tau